MKAGRFLTTCSLALSLALPVLAVGCAPKQDPATANKMKPGSMPEGGDWTGVWYSQLYGHLHLVSDGSTASGKWRTSAGDKWGELSGKTNGDILKFQWTEHTIGMVGPSASSKGHGYFRYVRPKGDNVDDEIQGEWGLDESHTGQVWTAIKQRNQKPDPASVKPSESESGSTTSAPGGWD